MRITALLGLLIAVVAIAFWSQRGHAPIAVADVAKNAVPARPVAAEHANSQSAPANSKAVERSLVGHSLLVRVLDAHGQQIDGAELVEAERERGRFPDYPEWIWLRSILGGKDVQPLLISDGQCPLTYGEGEWVAFAVRAPGYRSVARAYAANEVPAEVDVELALAGGMRGTIVGGKPKGFSPLVQVWSVGKQPVDVDMLSRMPTGLAIDKHGRFADANLEPGSYRAALQHLSYQHMIDEHGEVPMLDQGTDQRGVVEFVVHAGRETVIEITPPVLGVLRGSVLLRGQRVSMPAVRVFATRPGEPVSGTVFGSVDWDAMRFGGDPLAQATAPDGSFRLLYAKAGPVELRLRHPDGHATSRPVVINLPPPSATDVVRDLELPAGEVRGRIAMASLEGIANTVTIALYPMHRAAEDPTFWPGWQLSMLAKCAAVKETATGEFAFRHLPAGDWLLRVHGTVVGDELLWQRVVNVSAGRLDLTTVEPPALVPATIRYEWDLRAAEVDQPPSTFGVRLFREHRGKPGAIWVASVHAPYGSGSCERIAPGRYTVVPFSHGNPLCLSDNGDGMNGPVTARPVSIEIRSDGSVLPNPVRFSPLPVRAKPTDHK